jgi:hypothetical protein
MFFQVPAMISMLSLHPHIFNSNLTPVTLKLFLYKAQFHSASYIVYYGEVWAIHHADNRRQFGAQMRFIVKQSYTLLCSEICQMKFERADNKKLNKYNFFPIKYKKTPVNIVFDYRPDDRGSIPGRGKGLYV